MYQVHVHETLNGAETFKMQWPIIGSTILVYNRNRSIQFELPTNFLDGTPDLLDYLKDQHKIYVRGRVTEDKQFDIQEIVGGFDYGNRCGW